MLIVPPLETAIPEEKMVAHFEHWSISVFNLESPAIGKL